jgi:cyclopropane fatty-acyl-phospholipid synthase-like methyltransferase
MLQVANLKPSEVLYDLGAGDGRIVILAAQEVGARAVGVELREDLVERARAEIKRLKLEGKVRIVRGNILDIDVSEADVVTLYLTSSGNEKLRPKLERELKQGARVVSHDFKMNNWKPTAIYNEILGHTIYAYTIGAHLPR